MNQNEIITAIVALMVCGLLAGVTAIPLIAGISQETITEEYNDESNAGWLRMAYDNKPFDVEITADGDNISAGGQTGLNDDMILYADASACVMSVNGAFVIVNGYAATPEVINATSVAITNADGSLTVEADGDNVITATSPAWAYYPDATGKYAYFGADVDGVKIKASDNHAFAGTFAGVMAYNNIVVAPNGYGDLGLSLNAVVEDDIITSVTWAVQEVADTLGTTAIDFNPSTITLQPIDTSIINDRITSGGVGLMAINPGQYNDGTFTFNLGSDYAVLMSYIGPVTSNLIIPASVTYNGVDYPVRQVNNCVSNSSLNDGATLTISDGISSISQYAFDGCSKFTGDLIIPNSVTSIGLNAFEGCTGFNTLKLNDGLTTIANHAFMNCKFTNPLILPDTITSLAVGAFRNCDFSGTLVIPENIPSLANYTFANTDFSNLIVMGSPTLTASNIQVFSESIRDVLNLGETEITPTMAGLNADEVRDNVPASGYIAPLSTTAVVTKEGAVYDLISLLPLIMVLGVVMMGVYVVGTRYA